jgi:phosphatidylserine/phosphatidylglycerophosphate/cardiolipin synthase-like enzyme
MPARYGGETPVLDWREKLVCPAAAEDKSPCHAKTMVIDGAGTLTGSMNWTRDAARNSEDLNLVSSPTVAAAYAAHWRERLAVSVRFDRREDWREQSDGQSSDG